MTPPHISTSQPDPNGLEPSVPPWIRAELAQKLRRLGLLVDERTLFELDQVAMHANDQRALADPGSARRAVEQFLHQERSGSSFTLTQMLMLLEHLRASPAQACDVLATTGGHYVALLAQCALRAARLLYQQGRTWYVDANPDAAVNFMHESQREFLFALCTGRLSKPQRTEALGKFAVASAFASRWSRTLPTTLDFALTCHRRSIEGGNQLPEAYGYLVELEAEYFNATGDPNHLEKALELATQHNLTLDCAELLLKRAILANSSGDRDGRARDANDAYGLAASVSPVTGVQFVRKALVKQLAFVVRGGGAPLRAEQVRLPYGFLTDLPGLSPDRYTMLRHVVLESLGDMRAFLQERGSKPNLVAQQVLFAVLRDSVDRGTATAVEDAELAVEVSRETQLHTDSRYIAFQYCDALLARAEVTGDEGASRAATTAAEELIGAFPQWDLPRFALARALSLRHGDARVEPEPERNAWRELTERVVNALEYRRSDLGGRSSVFAIEDARADLSTTLVFKPSLCIEDAEREAANLATLAQAVSDAGAESRFGVPRSLAVVELTDGEVLHVIERHSGTLLSDLGAADAASHLDATTEFLALYQRARGVAPEGQKGWRDLKKVIKLWSRTLFREESAASGFVAAMRESMPVGLPLVAKRDAHAGNWVIDAAGRVIAVDLEAASFTPLGHDVAQLIEDYALVPVSADGMTRRQGVLAHYINVLNLDVDVAVVRRAYGWFALLRAAFVSSSATASKARHAHAR